jgi:hypothetical protein
MADRRAGARPPLCGRASRRPDLGLLARLQGAIDVAWVIHGDAEVSQRATQPCLWPRARPGPRGRVTGRSRPALMREVPARPPGRHHSDRAARMRGAVGADRAVHNPLQATAPGCSHHEHIAGAGDLGQQRARVAFRRLDRYVKFSWSPPSGGTERTPGQFPGQLAWHHPGEAHYQVAAAAVVMPPASVPGQPEPPRPDGNQLGPPRPRQRHRAAQCRHTAGRVIHTHDDPSALHTTGMRRHVRICPGGCHHLSPPAAWCFHRARPRDGPPEAIRPACAGRSA